ncbi:MAG: YhbY family RNA-binding protein [Chromatiales bacterium]|nr:YhbY family RNA-binding protein [Chromatiales bacterium]
MKSLDAQQIRHLRGLGHQLRPVVMIGQHGLTDGVFTELEAALNAHELVKLRVSGAERAERDAMVATVVERTGAVAIQKIGHVVLLYRVNPKQPRIVLPKPERR